MDKINIVSSQAVLEMNSFIMDARSMSSLALVNSLVKNRLFKTTPDTVSVHPHYGFVCGRHDAAWQPGSGNPPDWDLGCLEATGWAEESLVFLTQQFNCCTCAARCAGARSCWNTKSLPDTLRITGSSMTSLWRREAAFKKSVRDITRISCFVTATKLTHALHIYSTVFVKKYMRLHFFKVVQQQTTVCV